MKKKNEDSRQWKKTRLGNTQREGKKSKTIKPDVRRKKEGEDEEKD